jgi:hypothetical protein
MAGADQLHQEFPESLAVIEWHNGDEFATAWSNARISFYGVTGFPTAEFDGIVDFVGGYDPTSYPYYLPIFEERIGIPSNFTLDIEIAEADGTDYTVTTTWEMLEGNSSENLSAFVVLTETDVTASGAENQNFVARMVYPDINGTPMDFSSQTIHTLTTTVTLEDDYVFDNCEIVIFIQNMDTKEIYQGYSMMMSDMYVGVDDISVSHEEVTVYPNPASDVVNIKSGAQIVHLAVFNHSGQLVYNADASSTTYNLSVGTFESGLYLFRVTTAEGTTTKRIVVK